MIPAGVEAETETGHPTVSDDWRPYVRFAEDKDGATHQHPTLRPVTDPIPTDVVYASPIYLLTEEERERLATIDEPYAVPGPSSIAKVLQDRCETEGRVRYPVHIESDGGESWQEQIEWIRAFLAEHLPIDPMECSLFFSGGRSVHAHLPVFTTESGLEHLRAAAEAFDGDLDPTIYGRKRQFRLPGVRHAETGFPKVPIEWEWSDTEIGKQVVTADAERPATMAALLRETIGPDWMELPTWEPGRGGDRGTEVTSEPHLWEPGMPEPAGGALEKWRAYNRHAFSPYALAEGGQRSIALIRPIGGAFAIDDRILLPSRIYIAITANGELWHTDGPCPVLVSDPDYAKIAKMDVLPGDDLLLIGGRSRRCRIEALDWETTSPIWDAVLEEADPHDSATRADTLATIEEFGIDPGRPGLNAATDAANTTETSQSDSGPGPTRAARLQRRAETEGIDSLTHQERLDVANCLLQTEGIEGAIDWHREQFGDAFDEGRTRTQLRSIANRFDDLPSM